MKPSFFARALPLFLSVLLGMDGVTPAPARAAAPELPSAAPDQYAGDPVVFAVIGDYGSGDEIAEAVSNLVKSWEPDFIVTTGDNNNPVGAAHSIDANIGRFYHEFIHPYKGAYGEGSDIKRFFPALGNHDWMSNGAVPFFDYFSFYSRRGYYEFLWEPLHFFMVDSDPNEPDGITQDSKQAKWLREALAASTSPFNIVVLHHPPYSSGRHGSTEVMQWPYKAWGADAVLSGHDHLYERILVDDLPYFTNGMGGSPLYFFREPIPGSQVRFNGDHGAMRGEATSTYAKFQAFTREGLLIDEYTISNGIPVATAITRNQPNPTNQTDLTFRVVFSQPVSGVDASDFQPQTGGAANAFITDVSGSESAYVVTLETGPGEGSLQLVLLDDDSILNAQGVPLGGTGAGNGGFLTGETYQIDKLPPRVQSIRCESPGPTNAVRFGLLVTFSEPVTGVDPTDFRPAGDFSGLPAIPGVTGEGSEYRVEVDAPAVNGDLSLMVQDDGTILDAAGNRYDAAAADPAHSSLWESCRVDTQPPGVASIRRLDADPASARSVRFQVDFSEPVTGLDESDFLLVRAASGDSAIRQIEGSGSRYQVIIDTGTRDDRIRLDLLDDDSLLDSLGNPLGGIGPGNGSFTPGEEYTLAKPLTYVRSILNLGANPTFADAVRFEVLFSEPVEGLDPSDFIIQQAGLPTASIASVVQAGASWQVLVNTGPGEGTLRLDLRDDDSVRGSSGLPLGGPGSGNGDFDLGAVATIDRTPPRVTSIIRAAPDPSGSGQVDFIATFSESVRGVDAGDFFPQAVNLLDAAVLGVQDVNPFYIISVSTGFGEGTLRLDLVDDDSITDAAGNPLGGSNGAFGDFTGGEVFQVAKAAVNFAAPGIPFDQRKRLVDTGSPTLSWSPVRAAAGYELVIATDERFEAVLFRAVVRNTSTQIIPPLRDGTYVWRVRAFNASLEPGRFSAPQTLTVDTTPPAAPVLYTPSDGSQTTDRPSFNWEDVDSAINFHILIDDQADFGSPVREDWRKSASYRSSRLPAGTYYWRVQAKDSAGNWGDWSSPFAFEIP